MLRSVGSMSVDAATDAVVSLTSDAAEEIKSLLEKPEKHAEKDVLIFRGGVARNWLGLAATERPARALNRHHSASSLARSRALTPRLCTRQIPTLSANICMVAERLPRLLVTS